MDKTDDNQAGWNDITSELRDLCGQLQLGELVHEPSFGMFEAMSAIEIGDPKMDSGMLIGHCKNRPRTVEQMCTHLDGTVIQTDANSKSHETSNQNHNDSGVTKQPTQNGIDVNKLAALKIGDSSQQVLVKLDGLRVTEMIGLIDEFFACFITWLDGSSPMQTVYTNWYLQHISVLRDNWLRAVTTVFAKIIEHTRDKVTLSGVYDEEEFQPNYSSVVPRSELPDQRAASTLKEVEDELNKRIRAAKQRLKNVQTDGSDQSAESELTSLTALLSRVRFMRSFFLALLNVNKDNNAHGDECERQLLSASSTIEEVLNTLNIGWRAEKRVDNDVVYTDDEYYQLGFDSFLNHRQVAAVIPRCASIVSRRVAYEKLAANISQLRIALGSLTQLREDQRGGELGSSSYEALCAFLRWFTRTHSPSVLVRACIFLLIYPTHGTQRFDPNSVLNRARVNFPIPNSAGDDASHDGELPPSVANTLATRFEPILSLPLFGGESSINQLELTRTSLRTTTSPVAFNLVEQSSALATICASKLTAAARSSEFSNKEKEKEDRVALNRETIDKLAESIGQLDEFLAQLSSTQFARISALCLNCARQHERLAHALDDLSVLQDDADRLDSLFRDALSDGKSKSTGSASKGGVANKYPEYPEPQESCFGAYVLLSTFECVLEHVQSSFELELYSHAELHYVFWFLSDILFSYMQQVLSMCERAFVLEFDRCAALGKRDRKAASSKKHNVKDREKEVTAQSSREWKQCMRQRMFAYAQQQLSNALLRFIAALAIEGRYEVGSFRYTDEETRFRNRFRFFGAHLLTSNQLYDNYHAAWLKLTDPQHAAAAADCACDSGHHSHPHPPHQVPTRAQLVANHFSEANHFFAAAAQSFENLQRDLAGAEKSKLKSATQSSPKSKSGDGSQKTEEVSRPSLADIWQLGALVKVAKTNAVVSSIFQRAAYVRATDENAAGGTVNKRVVFDFSAHACYPVLKLV